MRKFSSFIPLSEKRSRPPLSPHRFTSIFTIGRYWNLHQLLFWKKEDWLTTIAVFFSSSCLGGSASCLATNNFFATPRQWAVKLWNSISFCIMDCVYEFVLINRGKHFYLKSIKNTFSIINKWTSNRTSEFDNNCQWFISERVDSEANYRYWDRVEQNLWSYGIMQDRGLVTQQRSKLASADIAYVLPPGGSSRLSLSNRVMSMRSVNIRHTKQD